jgi:hypothetical protein
MRTLTRAVVSIETTALAARCTARTTGSSAAEYAGSARAVRATTAQSAAGGAVRVKQAPTPIPASRVPIHSGRRRSFAIIGRRVSFVSVRRGGGVCGR